MDPLTHALTGAAIAWAATGRTHGRRALAIGAAAALLPDLDVLIRSSTDPLLAIEHHRGFTHSLLFAPLGGLITALPFRRTSYRHAAVAATLAWLSHALLDAATTYGTRVFWPFSRYRVGLDIISIIDPLFTLIVLIAAIAAWASRRRVVAIALAGAVAWLALGFVQRERAFAAQARLGVARGESIERGAVFPTIGNTIVWRSIYETGGSLRIDRIRVPWLGEAAYAPVTKVPRVTGVHHRDFDRFAWFADGWVARAPGDPSVIGDARYSLRSDAYEPVWGIRIQRRGTEWVDRTRGRDVSAAGLWNEIRGRDAALRPLP